ncbi:hypothetical protein DFJ58DRAFT_733679 [Suillus subalutaceus]|uniref:uncharacterized protein n=1 Tax=Suillus subalutaceus TaxID=48586 RepID=UPI001B85EC22|nr:uncharacterized protein DFJ58DRAFT_733679 [Suillus subalutaceus]KAG1838735.1 hypothetical protein DFJ58DRAFT_733679 [Suillus subalutaceus]
MTTPQKFSLFIIARLLVTSTLNLDFPGGQTDDRAFIRGELTTENICLLLEYFAHRDSHGFYTNEGSLHEINDDDLGGVMIATLADDQQIISGSWAKTTRQWDLKADKKIEDTWGVCGEDM